MKEKIYTELTYFRDKHRFLRSFIDWIRYLDYWNKN